MLGGILLPVTPPATPIPVCKLGETRKFRGMVQLAYPFPCAPTEEAGEIEPAARNVDLTEEEGEVVPSFTESV